MFNRAVQTDMTLQRSRGACHAALGSGGIADLYQSGSAKLMLPRVSGPPELVFLNTSGGLASGDRLDLSLSLAPRVTAIATTQTAERAYRADGGPAAQVAVQMSVGADGWLDWLPQETILFDGADLTRETRIDLAPGAGCLVAETVVLGRAAMGETVRRLALRDRRMIRREGRPLAAEHLHMTGESLAREGAAMLAGARAFATLIRIGPGDWLAPARAVLTEPEVRAVASAVGDRLCVRLAAPDLWPLRRQLARLLTVLRPFPLPRCWQM